MANSPKSAVILTPYGMVRVAITYVRPFTQAVAVETCWAHKASINHSCDEMGCWGNDER